jgi:hypothetical protein
MLVIYSCSVQNSAFSRLVSGSVGVTCTDFDAVTRLSTLFPAYCSSIPPRYDSPNDIKNVKREVPNMSVFWELPVSNP